MKGFSKKLVALALGAIALTGLGAQAYPDKAIQVVVPAGAGGDTDVNCRIVGKYLEKELGQPIVVVNVNGGGGTLGSRKVKDSAPDGYTALFYHPSMFLNQMMGLVDYGFSDFENAGIAVMDNTNIFVVSASSPYKNLQDLIKAAKANPGKIKFATETGGFTHLQILAFQAETGVQFNIVDVGAAAQKIVALLGRQVDAIGISYGIIKDYVTSNKFRVIGVESDARNPLIPEVATFKEQGVNISFPKFFYYLFPKGTPQAVINKFDAALAKVAADPALKAELNKFMVDPVYIAPAEAIKYMNAQQATYFNYKDLILNAKTTKEEVKK
ncbi:MAG TPA: tripartite tricarboxylate transporter substrate binding protein [Rectinemataceae bacterium]|nr:tripartite tricarboxylate transporter substrate binding protein [Rectinemataceae bacterium]